MLKKSIFYFLLNSIFLVSILTSCKKGFEPNNYVAYFGGEIVNPQNNYILFLKDDVIVDTIFLDKNNRFLHKFDSLAPGLYTFKHLPEYQYVFFDKNDSIMVRLNTQNFDNSLAFCGRGDEKNNYLIDSYLKNEKDRSFLYDFLDRDVDEYTHKIDSSYKIRKTEYIKSKAEIEWSEDFDQIALADLNFNYYYKKELYPYVYQYRTGKKINKSLPNNFYDYRKTIDFNNANLTNYSPFIKFINAMLNNITYSKSKGTFNEISLENNINKLNIADTLINNPQIKNVVLNNIAYMYLLEDQNMYNNKKFIDRYLELSTDEKQQEEVSKIANAVKNLKIGNKLPNVKLINSNLDTFDLNTITKNKETIIFFWTSNAESHIKAVHKNVMELKKEYPNLNFIAINVNDTQENWQKNLNKYNIKEITQLKAVDFEKIKKEWVITKIHRSILLNPDGSIKNAFVNLFDANFKKNLN
jgi:peroxiredoxin